MKIANSLKNEPQHDSNLKFIARVALIFLLIYLLRYWILSIRYLIFVIGPLMGLLLIRIKGLLSGESFKKILKDYITFIPYNYTEREWRYDRKIQTTYILILINVVVHYLLHFGPDHIHADIIMRFSFVPANTAFLNWLLSPLLCTFLHLSHGHLWGNMIFLWAFGTVLERRIGWKRFVLLYLATGIGSSLFSGFFYYEFLDRTPHGIGATGAITGIMGVCIVRLYYKRMVIPVPILGFFSAIIPIGLKLRINSLIIIGLDFAKDLTGWIGQLNGIDTRTDHSAHIAGLVCGMIGALWLKLRRDTYEEKHLEKGLRTLERNTFPLEGEEELHKVLARNPQNVTALLALARENSRYKPTCKGYLYYQKALKILIDTNPRQAADIFVEYLQNYTRSLDPELQYRLAGYLYRVGKFSTSKRALELVLKNDKLQDGLRKKILNHLALARKPLSRVKYRSRHEFKDKYIHKNYAKETGGPGQRPAARG